MKTRRISDLIKVADQGGIVLPDFQRSFKYGFEKQQNLLASLLSGIPLGSVLTLQGAANTFSHRKIGRRDDAVGQVVSQNEAIFLLDGQQRLTSLWFALTDVYHGCQGTDAFNALYDKLATNLLSQRWFLRFRVEEGQEDIWGYNLLKLPCANASLFIHQLTPDEVLPYILSNSKVKTGSKLKWGLHVKFPDSIRRASASEKAWVKYIRENRLVPFHVLHDISEVNKFVLDAAQQRASEIQNELVTCKKNNEPWANLSQVAKRYASEIMTVNSGTDWSSLVEDDIVDEVTRRRDRWVMDVTTYFRVVQETEMGVEELTEVHLHKAHKIFEVINQGGEPLSVFDLFCASKPGLDIKSRLLARVPDKCGLLEKGVVIGEVHNQFLNLLRVIEGYKTGRGTLSISALKGREIFAMSSDDLDDILDDVITALVEAVEWICVSNGAGRIKGVPYKLMIIPVAYYFYLKSSGLNAIENNLKYWYWVSLCGGRYRESQNQSLFEDVQLIHSWSSTSGSNGFNWPDDYVRGGVHWKRLLNYAGYNDLESLCTHNEEGFSAAVRDSLMQWVAMTNPGDFPGGHQNLSDAKNLDAHHVLPLGSFGSIGESSAEIRKNPKHILNSPLNFVLISRKSNNAIGAKSYAQYKACIDSQTARDYHLPSVNTCCSPGLWPRSGAVPQQVLDWLNERHEKLLANMQAKLDAWR